MTHSINIVKATKSLDNFVSTYKDQLNYSLYSDKTYLNDMLYGLGSSIDEKKYFAAKGYDEFLKFLKSHIESELKKS
jgi:hypothetical protein